MYSIVLKGSFTNVHFNKHIQSYKHQAICGMDWQVPAQKWTWISDEEKLLQFYLRVTSQGAQTKKEKDQKGHWRQNTDTVFPRIISSLEHFPPLNSFWGNYSIYEVNKIVGTLILKLAMVYKKNVSYLCPQVTRKNNFL